MLGLLVCFWVSRLDITKIIVKRILSSILALYVPIRAIVIVYDKMDSVPSSVNMS
jgi:hypothetical protein